MSRVVVNDASCLIDLRKGGLLQVMLQLPYQFVVPLPIRRSEVLDLTVRQWDNLTRAGMETYDLSPVQVEAATLLKTKYCGLSANDCLCLAVALSYNDGVLLTGDKYLGKIANKLGVLVHGVLWIVDELKAADACSDAVLIDALEVWKADQSVFLPKHLIDQRISTLG